MKKQPSIFETKTLNIGQGLIEQSEFNAAASFWGFESY